LPRESATRRERMSQLPRARELSPRGHTVLDPPGPTGARAAAEHVGEGHAHGGGTGRELEGGDSEREGDESRADSGADSGGKAGDGDAAYQAFTARWYEARCSADIAPRSDIPDRFDPRYPVGFEAEFVAYNRTFCTGVASAGLEAEANALYANSADLTQVTNALAATVRRLKALEARIHKTVIERLRVQELTIGSGTGQLTGQDKPQQDIAGRAGQSRTSRTGRDKQDRAGRAGPDETSRTGPDEQDEQDRAGRAGRAKVSRIDDLDLELVASFELETNQSGSGFI
jgi:hypothetical protein